MFDRIAPAYDVMNTVMTAGIDARWRRDTIAELRLRPGMHVLDVATGTGKLKHGKAGKRHLNAHMTGKRTRQLRRAGLIPAGLVKKYLLAIGEY